MSERATSPDFSGPIRRLQALAARWPGLRDASLLHSDAARRHSDLVASGGRTPALVVGAEVGAELGRPPARSHALVLTTSDPTLVCDGRVRVAGPALGRATPAAGLPLGQVVIAVHAPGAVPDRIELERAQHWTDRLPGVMSRAVAGRLWLRVGRAALARGLDLLDLGLALVASYRRDFAELTAVEALVLCDGETVGDLDEVAEEARGIAYAARRRATGGGPVADCPALDCEGCADRATCDTLREAASRYRQRSGR